MTVVQENLDLPGGVDPSGVTVTIQLRGTSPAGYGPSLESIVGTLTLTPDEDGEWSADLVPNSEIVPTGTVYRVVIEGGEASNKRRYISVPDEAGPLEVRDLLTEEPGAPASAALAVHAALRGPGGHLPDGTPDDGDVPIYDADTETVEWGPQSGGGGGGAVDSVNGETGVVVLTAGDIGSTATGDVAATNVQAAIAELASEKQTAAQVSTAVGAEATARDAAIEVHRADTTNIHGITDTSALETTSGATAKVAAEAAIARNADNLTSGTVADARIASTIARDSEVTSAANAAQAAAEATAAGALSTHAADTTAVHGIADTADLLTTADLDEIDEMPAASALDGSELALLSQGGIAAQRSYTDILADLGLVVGTDVQAWDAELDDLATVWTKASSASGSFLSFYEDTDLGTDRVLLGPAPAGLAATRLIYLPDASGMLAMAVKAVGAGLATTGTVDLSFLTLNDTWQTITATGAITFTTSNRAAGGHMTVQVDAGASNRAMVYPAWTTVGATLPATLLAGKRLVISLFCAGTTEASITAAGNVQG